MSDFNKKTFKTKLKAGSWRCGSMACFLGLSNSQLSGKLNYPNTFTADEMIRVSRVLNTTPGRLFGKHWEAKLKFEKARIREE